jgi:hypothetical protein
MIIAAIVLVAMHEPSRAEVSLEEKQFFSAYEQCVVGYATRFAGSPDSAEFIVRTAIGACIAEKRAFADAVHRVGKPSAGELVALLNVLDRQVSQAAAMAVLQARTAK